MQPLGREFDHRRVKEAQYAPLKNPASRKKRKQPRHLLNVWNVLAFALFAAASIYGAVIGGHLANSSDKIATAIDRILQQSGFGIEKIEVSGVNRITQRDVTGAITAEELPSLLGLNTEAAQAKIEKLPWVRTARVMRLLPSTLHIQIEEREPLAYWQYDGAHYAVDDAGSVILAAEPGDFGPLPLIVGDGAPEHASILLSALMRYPNVASRVKAFIRVADRRWNIALRSGTVILLPEKKVGQALRKFAEHNMRYSLLKRPLATIDMRVPGRLAVRQRDKTSPTIGRIIGANVPTERPAGDV